MSASLSVMISENAEIIPLCQPKSIGDTSDGFADRFPRMSQNLQTRLDALIKAANLSVAAAERHCGLKKDTLRKLLKNPLQAPAQVTLRKVAQGFGVSEQWLLTGDDASSSPQAAAPEKHLRRMVSAEKPSEERLPVLGMAAGSLLQGAHQLSDGAFDEIDRPSSLRYAQDVYILLVSGYSMEPMFRHGSKIAVSKRRPWRVGDAVVVQELVDDAIYASIGILEAHNHERTIIGKLNPFAKVTIPTDRIHAIHRVVSYEELLG